MREKILTALGVMAFGIIYLFALPIGITLKAYIRIMNIKSL
jgi:hypothetical protein